LLHLEGPAWDFGRGCDGLVSSWGVAMAPIRVRTRSLAALAAVVLLLAFGSGRMGGQMNAGAGDAWQLLQQLPEDWRESELGRRLAAAAGTP